MFQIKHSCSSSAADVNRAACSDDGNFLQAGHSVGWLLRICSECRDISITGSVKLCGNFVEIAALEDHKYRYSEALHKLDINPTAKESTGTHLTCKSTLLVGTFFCCWVYMCSSKYRAYPRPRSRCQNLHDPKN